MKSTDDSVNPFPGPSSPVAEVGTIIARLLEGAEWEIRAEAAKSLGQRGDLQAIEPLCLALTDKIWHVRIAAVGALGRLKDVRAVEALCRTLGDTDWYIRIAATVALGEIGDVRAVEPLCALLHDPDAPVRTSAADALGKIGDVWAVEVLCRALASPEAEVCRSAAAALDQMGTADTLPLKVLASMTLPPAGLLNTLQAMADSPLRIAKAGMARGKARKTVRYAVGNVQAFCEGLCRQSGTEESVRRGAEAVLAELRNRAASEVLLRASTHDDTREKAELLRGVSGLPDTTPAEELLRAAETSSDPPQQEKFGLLARIFKRK